MSTLWNKFTAWLSGWPLDTVQEKNIRNDDLLLAEQETKSKSTKPKTKKPKGLNPKKKKKSKGKKQGNLS